MNDLFRRALVAEFFATLILLTTVVGSAQMGKNLTNDVGLALLANSVATGAMLFVLITMFGPISGAHMNPIVTAYEVLTRARPAREFLPYAAAQTLGAVVGVVLANAMFDLDLLTLSTKNRASAAVFVSETVATVILLAVIVGVSRAASKSVAAAVCLYITAGYWFTSSMAFANPAVTIARIFTSSPAGLDATSVGVFVVAQLLGLVVARAVLPVLFRRDAA